MHLDLTPRAYEHFLALIKKEQSPGMGLRIAVERPGTRLAEVAISFCPAGEEKPQDLQIALPDFKVYIDPSNTEILDEAHIDYEESTLGGQLSITAPHLRGKKPSDTAPLAERVNFILTSEINPSLAQHKGMVSLVEITEDNIVVLKFGGGCHGCSMVDLTLKQGVERNLKEQLPEIKAVRDSTDHATGTAPYYV